MIKKSFFYASIITASGKLNDKGIVASLAKHLGEDRDISSRQIVAVVLGKLNENIESFITGAMNYIGEQSVNHNIDITIRGNAKELNGHLYNLIINVFRNV